MARIARVTAQGYPPSDMEFLLRHEGLLDRRLVPGKPGIVPPKPLDNAYWCRWGEIAVCQQQGVRWRRFFFPPNSLQELVLRCEPLSKVDTGTSRVYDTTGGITL
jgi:hypothetical protein